MHVDRDQIRRDADDLTAGSAQKWRMRCLTLLTELEQADQEKRLSHAQISRLTEQVNEAETRLSNLPALVEALKWAVDWLEYSGGNPQPNAAAYLHEALTAYENPE